MPTFPKYFIAAFAIGLGSYLYYCKNMLDANKISKLSLAFINFLIAAALLGFYRVFRQFVDMSGNDDYKNAQSIYDFTVKDTYGNDVPLSNYKGHVVLIVNIASKCGLTKNNYEQITELKKRYYDQGLRVLSFPCNQFSSQMPEADGEVMVCHLRDAKADVGDVFKKIDVNGDNADPLYKYLKHKQSGSLGSTIKWNFTKFLVNKKGIPEKRYAPTTNPKDIAKDIEKLL